MMRTGNKPMISLLDHAFILKMFLDMRDVLWCMVQKRVLACAAAKSNEGI